MLIEYYIITILFVLITLRNQNKDDPKRANKISSIQYNNRKREAHARVFS